MLHCRMSSSSLLLCLSLALLALRPPPLTRAQLQLANINMSRAVEILEERFRQLANDGLGVDALKVSMLKMDISYFKISQSAKCTYNIGTIVGSRRCMIKRIELKKSAVWLYSLVHGFVTRNLAAHCMYLLQRERESAGSIENRPFCLERCR